METNTILFLNDCNAAVEQAFNGQVVRTREGGFDCSERSRMNDLKLWACSMPGIIDPHGYCGGVPNVEYAPGYEPAPPAAPGGSQTQAPGGSQTQAPGGSQIMILAGLAALAWLFKKVM